MELVGLKYRDIGRRVSVSEMLYTEIGGSFYDGGWLFEKNKDRTKEKGSNLPYLKSRGTVMRS